MGFTKRFMTRTQEKMNSPDSKCKRTLSSIQRLIQDVFVNDLGKASKKGQLLKPVSELHNDFVKATKSKESLRSFH